MTAAARRALYAEFLALRAPPAASSVGPTPAQFADLIRARALPASGFEHVTVRASTTGLDVVVFVLAVSPAAGRALARRLSSEVVAQCGAFDGWTVTPRRISDVRRLVDPRIAGGRAGTG